MVQKVVLRLKIVRAGDIDGEGAFEKCEELLGHCGKELIAF
jgi:hypothetical protein